MNKILAFVIAVQSLTILILIFFFQSMLTVENRKETEKLDRVSPSPVAIDARITGWFAAWDAPRAEEALAPVMSEIEVFSPMLYRIMPGGVLGRHDIDNREEILNYANDEEVPIAPVITDESDNVRVRRILNIPSVQENFIDDLIQEAKNEGFTGWSIDIEKLTSSDRRAFSNFIENASDRLHENDLKLYVIVYGRVEDEDYDPALAHDYKVIGENADQVQLMTYNFNNETTEPGPQTPLDWYREVLAFATDTIPKHKILVGLSTHGYDWGEEVTGLTYQEVNDLVNEEQADVSYNDEDAVNTATYTEGDIEHSLWYEDARSIYEKMRIAEKEFGINKFAFWRIGAEDTNIWDIIDN